MERFLQIFRAQPALIAISAILAISLLVLGIFATVMLRSGMSLRPLVFFGGFLGLILVPQALYHTLAAFGMVPPASALSWAPGAAASTTGVLQDRDEVLAADERGAFRHADQVFGAGFDRDLISDVRRLFEAFAPEVAQMAASPQAEMVLVARFADGATAQRAATHYFAMMGTRPGAPGAEGARTARRAGDFVRVLVAGRTLFAWTGADTAALDRRMAASSAAWSSPAAAIAVEAPRPNEAERVRRWRLRLVEFAVLNVVLAVGWFFKGAAWASAVPAQPQAWPPSASELRSRLLAVDRLPQPVSVSPGRNADELVVTWRYADAAWLDLARAHRVTRTHRLVLRLDEAKHVVRVTEYWSRFDASAGAGGFASRWQRAMGISFFEYQHERVFGLQFDPATGRLKPEASYAYTFDVREMKAPLIAAVTHAGWRWQPVMLDVPGLRWLTE